MKTLLRVFAVTVFLTTVGIVSASAQDQEKCPDLGACFEIFKAELNKPCGSRDKAVEIGGYIAERWKEDPDNGPLVARIAARVDKERETERVCKRNNVYNESYNGKRWDDFLNVSKEILSDPTTDKNLALDIMLTHVSTGYDRTADDKNDKFNNDTLMYAKTAIQLLDSGTGSKTGKFGTFNPFLTKENATSWMNYMIGFINYYRLGPTSASKKDEAIQYFYKATQVGEKKTDPFVFRDIGVWYAGKATDLFGEYTKLIDAAKKYVDTGDKAVDDAAKEKLMSDAKSNLALARAYADRAIDALGRAQRLATDAKAKSDITDSLTEFYKFRFNGKVDGLDKYVSDMIAKPMPDPSSTVTPVSLDESTTSSTEAVETTVPTKVAASTPVMKSTTAVATTVKPATAKVVKPVATAKKPVAKKKGTR